MAYFDKDELIDCIRHSMALVDDSGLTGKGIPPPRRKVKPGGLPLEMCRRNKEEEYYDEREDGPSSLFLPLVASSSQPPVLPIREQIRQRLLNKLEEMDRSGRINKAAQPVAQRPTECTIHFEQKEPMAGLAAEKVEKPEYRSLTARLLAETNTQDASRTFAEYAKFEAMEGATNAKRFNILFPFAEQRHCAIPICIVRSANIAELIGLACHYYTRQQQKPACDTPSEYDLYLAEEDLQEYDTELPPQDRRRRVADCGFPNLAMVKRAVVAGRRHSQRVHLHQIHIYLPDGRTYTKQLEDLDTPLRQLFDWAMERKREEDQQQGNMDIRQNMQFFRELAYMLEPFDQPGVALDLHNSISSSGTFDFVLLRVNSARGDLLLNQRGGPNTNQPGGTMKMHSRSVEFSLDSTTDGATQSSKPVTPTTPGEKIDWSKRRARLSAQFYANSGGDSRRSIPELAQISSVDSAAMMEESQILEEFQIYRIHRFQPKAAYRLVVRELCLELTPNVPGIDESKKKRGSQTTTTGIASVKSGKVKRIPWELIAAVEVPPNSEQKANARRIVRIICLSGISAALTEHIIQSGKSGRPLEGNSAYDGSYWKTLLIEAAAHEAWQIGVRLSELLESRPSQVHLIYQYSAGASLKPAFAAEKTFGATPKSFTTKSGHSPGAFSTVSRDLSITGGEKASKKKLSMIFSRMRP